MLRLDDVEAGYGDVQVLWGVDLEVRQGEIVALVGSNGAGKTTTLGTISGVVPVRAGRISYQGEPITNASSDHIVQLGISQVPQGRRLFAGLTVRENLMMGAFTRRDSAGIREDLERVLAFFPRLKERINQLAGKMSGGEQQMCAIGRGLMARPKLLMIDELSLGLAPVVVDDLLGILRTIREQGMTILLVEQDVQTALELADRGYVLETGQVSIQGPARSLINDEAVKRAYFGL